MTKIRIERLGQSYWHAILKLRKQADRQRGWSWCSAEAAQQAAAYEQAADFLERRAGIYNYPEESIDSGPSS